MGFIVSVGSRLERYRRHFTVEALARELPGEWVTEALQSTGRHGVRRRSLPADLTVWFVVLMGLFRGVSYANLLEKLDDTWWTRGRWSPECPPCTSAVSKARDRVGADPLRVLFERSAAEWTERSEGLMFHGRRVTALDGSTVKTPDSDRNREHFGLPHASRGRSGYPQMRVAAVVDVGTRLVTAVRHGAFNTGELALAREIVAEVNPGMLLLMDRNFTSYGLLWDIRSRGADFMVRVKRKMILPRIAELGPGDHLVEVSMPRALRYARPDLPATWTLREIVYTPEGGSEEIRLLTTVLDPEVGGDELSAVYHERWESETVFDEIKTHLCGCATVSRPLVFRSRTPERVEQELFGLLIAFNAIRMTMVRATTAQVGSPRRLSFTAAIERIREAIWDMMRLAAHRLTDRYGRMLTTIARAVVPARPGRHIQRCVKIKMSGYPLKRQRVG